MQNVVTYKAIYMHMHICQICFLCFFVLPVSRGVAVALRSVSYWSIMNVWWAHVDSEFEDIESCDVATFFRLLELETNFVNSSLCVHCMCACIFDFQSL